jgi:hypothetical protein
VDLSPAAIGRAKELAIRAGLEAEFICSEICAFERSGSQPYDIVFTSYGAVCWISDLERWADIISTNLAIGGTFYMAEFHPVYDLLAGYSYFSRLEPDVEEEASYTENASEIVAEFAVWAHPFTDVVNALIGAGIRIDRLNEFPFSPYNCFEGLEEREPGRFYLAHGGHDAPLVYSVTGTKIA